MIMQPSVVCGNYHPFVPLGVSATGTALVLVFWAYAGFELGTLPAAEVKDPRTTIPKAIIIGMSIVALFYISTNFIVYGAVNWADLATSSTPLILVGGVLLGAAGALIMTVGALFSVSVLMSPGCSEPQGYPMRCPSTDFFPVLLVIFIQGSGLRTSA